MLPSKVFVEHNRVFAEGCDLNNAVVGENNLVQVKSRRPVQSSNDPFVDLPSQVTKKSKSPLIDKTHKLDWSLCNDALPIAKCLL